MQVCKYNLCSTQCFPKTMPHSNLHPRVYKFANHPLKYTYSQWFCFHFNFFNSNIPPKILLTWADSCDRSDRSEYVNNSTLHRRENKYPRSNVTHALFGVKVERYLVVKNQRYFSLHIPFAFSNIPNPLCLHPLFNPFCFSPCICSCSCN